MDEITDIIGFMESIGYNFDNPAYGESYDYDRDESNTFGIITKHCEEMSINTISELINTISFDYRNYLSIINPESNEWHVSESFAILLLLIRARTDHFTAGLLVEDGWDPEIAERVIYGAHSDSSKS